MELNIEIPRKISLAYGAACKGLCRELDLPQTAFDILMFLGNNPAYKTASEIVELRHIKANLISHGPPQNGAFLHREGPPGHSAGAAAAGGFPGEGLCRHGPGDPPGLCQPHASH